MTRPVSSSRDELLDAITTALKAQDMPTVAFLVRRLAVVSPADAESILAGLDLAGAR